MNRSVRVTSNVAPPIRIGVIGCGALARTVHLPTLGSLDRFEVTAVADIDAGACAAALTLAPGARGFGDYRDLLEHGDADAVLVALPNEFHAVVAAAAVSSGRHVYLEKPVGITRDDLEKLRRAAATEDVVMMVGFNYRYHPLTRQLQDLVRGGAVGRVVAARSTFGIAGRNMPAWKRARHSGGGALLDLASHHFDLIEFIVGRPIVQVIADIKSLRTEHDVAAVSMTLADGVVVQSLFSFGAAARDEWIVYGDRGVLRLDRYSTFGVSLAPTDAESRPRAALRACRQVLRGPMLRQRLCGAGRDPSFRAALADFAAAIRGEPNIDRPNVTDGCRSLDLVLAAERSAATARPVEVADVSTACRFRSKVS